MGQGVITRAKRQTYLGWLSERPMKRLCKRLPYSRASYGWGQTDPIISSLLINTIVRLHIEVKMFYILSWRGKNDHQNKSHGLTIAIRIFWIMINCVLVWHEAWCTCQYQRAGTQGHSPSFSVCHPGLSHFLMEVNKLSSCFLGWITRNEIQEYKYFYGSRYILLNY